MSIAKNRVNPFKGAFAQLLERIPWYPTKVPTFLAGAGKRLLFFTVWAGNSIPVLLFILIQNDKNISSKNIEN